MKIVSTLPKVEILSVQVAGGSAVHYGEATVELTIGSTPFCIPVSMEVARKLGAKLYSVVSLTVEFDDQEPQP